MSTDRLRRIQTLFEDALSRPSAARSEFLDRACADDQAARAEVESLLKHDEEASAAFLQPPELPSLATAVGPDPLLGRKIARYEVKSVIAAGGMGTVYLAEQERPRRLVALKVVRTGLSRHSRLRRFDYESEILARLQHPNIAQVFEAGTYQEDAGAIVPYFAMEYVRDARSITEYVDQEHLSTRARLELFCQACDAVHYGHLKGIIHRDLKPANLLVDASGQLKVIDFGVARATDSDVTVTTMQTDVGTLIGTLQYMSPEQCEADPFGLDTRSDVYSLGVVLYGLLTGRAPYDLASRPIPSATRIICETEPTRPSAIDRKLRGDLEVIVLTAIEKDRNKRYQSAANLAEDIGRFLHRDPIFARQATRWTQALRWAARHPRLATTLTCLLIAAAIVGGTFTATSILRRTPGGVVVKPDGSGALLLSVSNDVLHEWQSVPYGVFKASALIDIPSSAGGGQAAAIGFRPKHPGDFSGQLCVFPLHGNLDVPLWQAGVSDSELPEDLVQRRKYFSGKDFALTALLQADVFAEVPGAELLVAYQHIDYTQTALRIYSPFAEEDRQKLLYQVWLDVNVFDMYWMADARQIVIAGLNGVVPWRARGFHPDDPTQHPKVVFALRPKLGLKTTKYVSEVPGVDELSPVWYRCIGPPELSNFSVRVEFLRPFGIAPLGRAVALTLTFSPETLDAGLQFEVDDKGNEVPGSRRTSDNYKSNQSKLPPENFVQLQDLPPLITTDDEEVTQRTKSASGE